uniref:Uncharacterized protein n=1 Tax=Acrobeloides nanus TaxID=290746 RepID=A0A914D4U9_9BILA
MQFVSCFNVVAVVVLAMAKFSHGQSNVVVCPMISDQPSLITATDSPTYILSQNLSSPIYFPNMDCRFVLIARNSKRRIHITILESLLEESLFTDCDDYVSIRDGNQLTSKEIVRWCGTENPIAITSSVDSVYVHFHSDGIIQKRGFNMSFVDFDIPGCPPDWIRDQENEYCYKLFEEPQGTTWLDSQKACHLERSNLLTIEDSKEYQFVIDNFSRAHSFPWIGYYDASNEGAFESVDETPLWPEQFPTFNTDHQTKDCIFFDSNNKDGIAYSINDCRTRHSFICKKRTDGSTTLYPPPTKSIRKGLETASVDYTFWIMILLLILLLSLIGLIIFYRCKKKFENQVGNVDLNQRLVHGSQSIQNQSTKDMQNSHTSLRITTDQGITKPVDGRTSRVTETMHRQKSTEVSGNNTAAKKNYATSSNHRGIVQNATVEEVHRQKSQQKSVSDSEDNTSPRFEMTPNQPLFIRTATTPPDNLLHQGGATNIAYEQDHDETTMQAEHSFSQTAAGSGLPQPTPNLQNEASVISSGSSRPSNYNLLDSSGGATMRSRREGSRASKIKSFERPHIGALDHVSAISLDEFWKQTV